MGVSPPADRRSMDRSGRWRWYYAACTDYRMAHPGCKAEDVAKHIGRHVRTVEAILRSDMYREYEAQRMQAWRDDHDMALRIKLSGVAIKALDSIDAQLVKKQDQVPLAIAREIAVSALDRLGFAPQGSPSVVVNNNQQVLIPNAVSPAALEEARAALRAVEQRRLSGGPVVDVSPVEVDAGLALAEGSEAPEADAPLGDS